MPTVPYVPAEISEPAPIVAAIRTRRGGVLLNLDRMLLHSPEFARGWNSLLGATRAQLSLPATLRELVICAVGVLNDAPYELHQHAGPFAESGGTADQLQALKAGPARWAEPGVFSAAQRAALSLTLAMTRQVRVPEPTLRAAREQLQDDRQLVELVGVIATYNMVSRFLVALDVGPEQP